ncbi:MAG TPA: cysteine hydrolase [Chloroflexota bacterium]|nr:cysteine hydrolase [Chloroflexota bacterium]
MAEPALDPRRTALLLFDMLKVYACDADGRVRPEAESQVAACRRMLDAVRALSVPVFYAIADHRPDGADWAVARTDTNADRFVDVAAARRLKPAAVRGSTGADVIDELAPREGDYLIRKHRWSAFLGTHLQLSLRTPGIDTICIAGGSTDVGVAATAYAARDHDFNVVVLRDGCRASRPEVDAFFMEHVFPRLGRVRTVDETIALLRAGHTGSRQ